MAAASVTTHIATSSNARTTIGVTNSTTTKPCNVSTHYSPCNSKNSPSNSSKETAGILSLTPATSSSLSSTTLAVNASSISYATASSTSVKNVTAVSVNSCIWHQSSIKYLLATETTCQTVTQTDFPSLIDNRHQKYRSDEKKCKETVYCHKSSQMYETQNKRHGLENDNIPITLKNKGDLKQKGTNTKQTKDKRNVITKQTRGQKKNHENTNNSIPISFDNTKNSNEIDNATSDNKISHSNSDNSHQKTIDNTTAEDNIAKSKVQRGKFANSRSLSPNNIDNFDTHKVNSSENITKTTKKYSVNLEKGDSIKQKRHQLSNSEETPKHFKGKQCQESRENTRSPLPITDDNNNKPNGYVKHWVPSTEDSMITTKLSNKIKSFKEHEKNLTEGENIAIDNINNNQILVETDDNISKSGNEVAGISKTPFIIADCENLDTNLSISNRDHNENETTNEDHLVTLQATNNEQNNSGNKNCINENWQKIFKILPGSLQIDINVIGDTTSKIENDTDTSDTNRKMSSLYSPITNKQLNKSKIYDKHVSTTEHASDHNKSNNKHQTYSHINTDLLPITVDNVCISNNLQHTDITTFSSDRGHDSGIKNISINENEEDHHSQQIQRSRETYTVRDNTDITSISQYENTVTNYDISPGKFRNNMKKRKKSKTKSSSNPITVQNDDKLSAKPKRSESTIVQQLSINAKEFKPMQSDALGNDKKSIKDQKGHKSDFKEAVIENNGKEINCLMTRDNKSEAQGALKPKYIIKRNCDKLLSTSNGLNNYTENISNCSENVVNDNYAQNEIDLIRNLCECDIDKLSITTESKSNGRDIACNKSMLKRNENDLIKYKITSDIHDKNHSIENDNNNDNATIVLVPRDVTGNILSTRNNCDSKDNIVGKVTPVLNCSDNSSCCSPPTTDMLSILENGCALNTPLDNDNYIDENDLPNYSQSCVYEQRIIDFENFRIIEQVIDSNCEGKHEDNNTDKCKSDCGQLVTGEEEENDEKWQKLLRILPNCVKIDNTVHTVSDIKNENAKVKMLINENNSQTVKKLPISQSSEEIVIDNNIVNLSIDNTRTENIANLRDVAPECPTFSKSDTKKLPFYTNPSLNFSCSELVAFIGDSFNVIDSAQALYKSGGRDTKEFVPKSLANSKAKESSSVGNSPFHRSKRAAQLNSNRGPSSNRSVDNNNNTRRYSGITAAERLMQSLNCDATRELGISARKEKCDMRSKAKMDRTNVSVTTPTKTLMKALKSKLTPLAPPFQPSSSKAEMENTMVTYNVDLTGAPSSCSGNSAAFLNYEHTTIYYQQQHPHQQQLSLPTASSNMLINIPPNQQQQQQQILSAAQHQHQLQATQQQFYLPQLQQTQQQQLLTHQHHQQHCTQNILAMSAASLMGQGVPHIHMSTTNNCNLSAPTPVVPLNSAVNTAVATNHAHLVPIQMVSTMGGAITSWPLVDTTTIAPQHVASVNPSIPAIYMDLNGELRSICPAHGPPAAVTVTAQHMMPVTNQAMGSQIATAGVSSSFNAAQYPAAVAYHRPLPQMHQHQQHHQHHHHNQQHQQQHTVSLANSQNSSLHINSNMNPLVAAAPTPTCGAVAATSPTSSSSSPRVVLQLDAGVSLPLQIAGKRKIIQGSDDENDDTALDFIANAALVVACRRSSHMGVPKSAQWYNRVLSNFDDDRIRQMLRIETIEFNHILALIKEDPAFTNKNSVPQFPIDLQLKIALFRLGSNGDSSSIRKIATLFGSGDGGTVITITDRVIFAVINLKAKFLCWRSPEERRTIVANTMDELPGCIGYVDGTEISNSNIPLKKQYSIKMQVVCDYSLKIRQATIGYRGSVHDAKIFAETSIEKEPQNFFSERQWIAGDSAYSPGND